MSISLNCDFLERAATSVQYFAETEAYPAHLVHSDGVCRDTIENTAVGFNIFLAPGRSDRVYDSCSADSVARYVKGILKKRKFKIHKMYHNL